MCAVADAAPLGLPGPVSPDEDVVLAQRYGADYLPQTDDGKKAQAAAIASAPNETVSTFWNDPCQGPSWTVRVKCANDLRDKAAVANKFPWMDLLYAYDAKMLQAAADVDANRIKKEEFLGAIKGAGEALQAAVTQRNEATQAQAQARQAASAQQAGALQRPVLLPPAAKSCSKVGDVVNCTND